MSIAVDPRRELGPACRSKTQPPQSQATAPDSETNLKSLIGTEEPQSVEAPSRALKSPAHSDITSRPFSDRDSRPARTGALRPGLAAYRCQWRHAVVQWPGPTARALPNPSRNGLLRPPFKSWPASGMSKSAPPDSDWEALVQCQSDRPSPRPRRWPAAVSGPGAPGATDVSARASGCCGPLLAAAAAIMSLLTTFRRDSDSESDSVDAVAAAARAARACRRRCTSRANAA